MLLTCGILWRLIPQDHHLLEYSKRAVSSFIRTIAQHILYLPSHQAVELSHCETCPDDSRHCIICGKCGRRGWIGVWAHVFAVCTIAVRTAVACLFVVNAEMRRHIIVPLGVDRSIQKRHFEGKRGRRSGPEAGLGSVVVRRPQVRKWMLRSYIDVWITERMERIKVSADPTGRTVSWRLRREYHGSWKDRNQMAPQSVRISNRSGLV